MKRNYGQEYDDKTMRKKYMFVAMMLLVIFVCGVLLASVCRSMQNQGGSRKEQLAGAELPSGKSESENDDGTVTSEKNGIVRIVTSFYPIYIEALNVTDGIDHVKLENMTGEQTGCLHDYQMTAEDMMLLADADVFVINGGGIESFLADVAAQYPGLTIVDTGAAFEEEADSEHEDSHDAESSEGHVHGHGGENAHYWMDVSRCITQVQEMAKGLAAADPSHADQYMKNSDAYCKKLQTIQKEAESVHSLTEGKSVVLFHEAYEYLADSLGMKTEMLLDLDEERQVSAAEISEIVRKIETNRIPAVFAEITYGEEYGTLVKKETDTQVLYLDTLVRGDYNKDSYLKGMEKNLSQVRAAFES